MEEFDILKEEYSETYVEGLKRVAKKYNISFEEVCSKLPSPDIVRDDEEFVREYPVGWVLMGMHDYASYVLTELLLTKGEIPSDYPEQPRYMISISEGSVMAPFTKQKFLDSIGKRKIKKIGKK